jgi:hypothetical protein
VIAVEANLRAENNGLRMRIDGRGRVLTCRLDGNPGNVAAALRQVRHLLPAFRAAIPLLVRTGLRLDIVVGPLRVASAGSGVRQNRLARLLELPSAQVGR